MTPLIIICVYLCILLGLGLFSHKLLKESSSDFFLASHSIGPFVLLMSVFGTTMTAFALVGSTGEAYRNGIGTYGKMASWSGLIHAGVFFLIGIRMWAYGKKYGYTTQIQYFRDRFESNGIGYLLFPILVGLVIPYLLIGILGAGGVVKSITKGAFPNAKICQYAPKNFGDEFGIKTGLDEVKRKTLAAALAQAKTADSANAAMYDEISTKLSSGEQAKLDWAKLGAVKTAAMELEGKDELVAAYSTAIGKYKEQGGIHKKSTDFNIKKKTGTYFNRAKATAREKKIFEENGIIIIKPDEIPNPLNGGIPPWLTGLVICAVVLTYVFFGGLRGAAWANTLQTIVFMITGIITFFFISSKIGGVQAASQAVLDWNPSAMTREKVPKVQFLTYFFVPLSVGMFPHLFQHWLTAKNAKAFRLTCIAHPLFIMIVWVPCVLIGVWATAAMMPGAADMSLIVPIDHAKNTELAIMVQRLATPALAGLLSAGILAAIMSSLDSQFLCLGTMFTTDIVFHKYGKEKFTPKQQIKIARCFIVAIVVITYLLSLAEPRRVFTLGVWCFSGFGGLFPLIFLSVYWKRTTRAGAIAGIVAAIAVWWITFAKAGYGLSYGLLKLGSIEGIMPAAAVFAACLVTTIVVSLVTKPPSDETIDKFFNLRQS